jgi:hypothetical protein
MTPIVHELVQRNFGSTNSPLLFAEATAMLGIEILRQSATRMWCLLDILDARARRLVGSLAEIKSDAGSPRRYSGHRR